MPSNALYGEYGWDESAARGTGPAPMTWEQQQHQDSLVNAFRAANPDIVKHGMGTPGGGGFGKAWKKVGKAAKFEVDRFGNLVKGVINDPSRLITGVDPLSTKLWNNVLGTNNQALVGQLGGATENDFQRYEAEHGRGSLGAARALSTSADAIAGMVGLGGALHGLGQAASSFGSPALAGGGGSGAGGGLGGGASAGFEVAGHGAAGAGAGIGAGNGALATGGAGGLGAFGGGGTAGLSGVGGGNAGALAASGGVAGGAGVGGTTAGALGGVSGLANSVSGAGNSAVGGSMGWGDWVNLGLQVGGSLLERQGAKDASAAEQAGIKAGIAEQARQYDTSRADQMPWLQSGTAALGRLNDPTAFTASPSYDFVRREALGGVENSAAARGGLFSGNAGRALEDRAANVASQEYGNWFNQNASLAGLGQASAQSLGGLGQQNATNVSNLLNQQGNARASGIAGQTNALTGGISDFLSWYNNRRARGG